MNRVRLVRILRNISLRDLAKHVSCSVGTIHAIEEEFNKPNVILARRITDMLDADLGLLFPDEEVYYDDRVTYYLQSKVLKMQGEISLDTDIEIDWLDQEYPTFLKNSEIEHMLAKDKLSRSYQNYQKIKAGGKRKTTKTAKKTSTKKVAVKKTTKKK